MAAYSSEASWSTQKIEEETEEKERKKEKNKPGCECEEISSMRMKAQKDS